MENKEGMQDIPIGQSFRTNNLAIVGVEMEEAAWREGIDPTGPLGIFVKAMQRALTVMAEASDRQASGVVRAIENARAMTEAEVAKAQLTNQLAATALDKAKTAHAGFEVQRERLITKLVDTIVPQMVAAVGEAVVIRERQHNQKVQWRRAFSIAALGGGLLLGGFVWGSWTPSVSTVEGVIAAERIKRCQAAPIKDTRTSETYCPMSVLMAPL